MCQVKEYKLKKVPFVVARTHESSELGGLTYVRRSQHTAKLVGLYGDGDVLLNTRLLQAEQSK